MPLSPDRVRRPRGIGVAAAVGVVLVLALTGCSGGGSAHRAARPASSGSGTGISLQSASRSPAASTRPQARPPARRATKLLVFIVENHSLGQMRSGMPYVARLARRYGYAADYRALTHPSLPNYLGIAGGSTFGVRDDDNPSAHPLQAPTVFGRALHAGRTARVYAEAMPGRCYLTNSGQYAVRHNPWTYFVPERAECRRHDGSLRRFARDVRAGHLPTVGMVVPDVCNDAHDCSLAQADAWLRRRVGQVLAGPDWASGHLAVVITADEDDKHHGNRILTVVADPAVRHDVVHRRLTHYSLARSYAEVAGVRPLRHARSARSLLHSFGVATPR